MTTTVIARCIGCDATCEIGAGEVPDGEYPMCDLCGMPMVAWKGKVSADPDGDAYDEAKIRKKERGT
jgi:hypothetical protein